MYILYQQWPAGGDSSKQKTAEAQKLVKRKVKVLKQARS